MDDQRLTFLPFPYVHDGKRHEGLTHAWPEPCKRCDRQCESDQSHEIGLCTYGLNYLRIDDSLLIAGVVAKDDPRISKNRSKMLKAARGDVVPSGQIKAVATRAASVAKDFDDELEKQKANILAEYRETEGYKADIVSLLKPSLEQTFAQVHDYRQLTSQIIQNVNVILQQANPGKTLDEQLDAAPRPIRSIYWAARLMEFKLDSALFLVYPERIRDASKRRSFRFHGSVMKYLAIYEPQMNARRITHSEIGQSFGSLNENPDAIGVIPHAFIDNAIKYAPDGSEIFLTFAETAESISLSVRSLGPRITKAERDHIWDLFFRAAAASETSEDGTGFGLGLARHVADEVGAKLSFSQESVADRRGYFWTTFSAEFRKAPPDAERSPLLRARDRARGGASSLH